MELPNPEMPRPPISWPEPLPGRITPVDHPHRRRHRQIAPAPSPVTRDAVLAPAPRAIGPLSPGLARLLNAAVIYPSLAAVFLEAPLEAAALVARDQGGPHLSFVPDSSLRPPPIVLDEADWVLLRRLRPSCSLAEAAGKLGALAAERE